MSPLPLLAIRHQPSHLLLLLIAIFISLSMATLMLKVASAQMIAPAAISETSEVRMVKDINGTALLQTTASSAIERFSATDDYLFFFVATASMNNQQELEVDRNVVWHLWRTDGTEEGTQRAIDLTGYERSDLTTQAGKKWLYFFATRNNDLYLFRTDGENTSELGAIPSNQSVLAQTLGGDDILYYVTGKLSAPAVGVTLWRVTPDSPAPTQLWQSGALASQTSEVLLQATPSFVYLVVHPTQQSPTLFVASHDEETLSSLMALDAWPSAASSSGNRFYFFVANDENNQLWRSSGTITETVSLFATPLITATKTKLFTFAGDNGQDQIYFTHFFPETSSPYYFYFSDLWQSNGTLVGTHMVKKFDTNMQMDEFQLHEGKVFFWLNTSISEDEFHRQDARLYVTDGTPQGTDYVNSDLTYSPTYTIIGNKHYFAHRGYGLGQELHVYDTALGGRENSLVSDINFGTLNGIVSQTDWGTFQNILYFPGSNGIDGAELWRSDGTAGGTWQVKNINTKRIPPPNFLLPTNRPSAEFLIDLSAGENSVYFVADAGRNGPHVYRSDGTEAGTNLLPNGTLNNRWTNPRQLTTQGNDVYFLAEDHLDFGEKIHGLWRSDGTEAGTRLLVDNLWGYQALLTVANNRLLLLDMPKMTGGWGLWRLNENQDKFEMLIDFSLWGGGGQEFSQVDFVSLANQTFFQNPTNSPGAGLWRSDATVGGTFRMDGYNGQQLLAGKTLVYGRILNSDSSIRYWRSDGTPEGTFELKTFYPSTAEVTAVSTREIVVGNRLFMTYSEWGKPIALWSSDGTVNGTQSLGELFTVGEYSPRPFSLAADGSQLYIKEFTHFSDELPPSVTIWRSDGTPGGTRPMMNLFGRFQETPLALMVNKGHIFFDVQASGGTYLIRTNGEALCTWIVADLTTEFPTPPNTNFNYVKAGDKIYFMSNDLAHGYELWVADTSRPLHCDYLYLPSAARH